MMGLYLSECVFLHYAANARLQRACYVYYYNCAPRALGPYYYLIVVLGFVYEWIKGFGSNEWPSPRARAMGASRCQGVEADNQFNQEKVLKHRSAENLPLLPSATIIRWVSLPPCHVPMSAYAVRSLTRTHSQKTFSKTRKIQVKRLFRLFLCECCSTVLERDG